MTIERARELIREASARQWKEANAANRLLNDAVAELDTDGWISVEERLPPEEEIVLAYVQRDRKATGVPYHTFDFVERRGDRWMNVNESGYWLWSNATVTHWQLLEPPKETRDD